MTNRAKTRPELLAEVLADRAGTVAFSAQDMEPRLARLRAGFARVEAMSPARRGLERALQTLPAARRAGWAAGVEAAVAVVLGTARRTSRIIVEGARDLLPADPEAFAFMPNALATRSAADDVTRADSVETPGAPSRTILVDDSGPEPRVVVTMRGVPADVPPPVLLVVERASEGGGSRIVEVDPEAVPEPAPGERRPTLRLRYEAVLPAGHYDVFLGNPREAPR